MGQSTSAGISVCGRGRAERALQHRSSTTLAERARCRLRLPVRNALGWLLDRGWFGPFDSRWLDALMAYLILLWIPALLYSACLWLLLRILRFWAKRIRGKYRAVPSDN